MCSRVLTNTRTNLAQWLTPVTNTDMSSVIGLSGQLLGLSTGLDASIA